jgi:BirA family biotin operon repressor/biotin-[acetyl-CoA-carboxylase] ligase
MILQHLHFDNIPSTQLYAREHFQTLRPDKWVLYTASRQSCGVGQQGRRWVSTGEGLDIYATYSFLIDQLYVSKLVYIPQVVCLQVVRMLNQVGIEASIKWINDILIGQKKICGVLCESFTSAYSAGGKRYTAVLLGIGVNVNATADMLSDVSQPSTSMFLETGRVFDLAYLQSMLSNLLICSISQLLESGFVSFLHDINAKLTRFDNKLVLFEKIDGTIIKGYVRGIGDHGQLIFVDVDNAEYAFIDGRLRPLPPESLDLVF